MIHEGSIAVQPDRRIERLYRSLCQGVMVVLTRDLCGDYSDRVNLPKGNVNHTSCNSNFLLAPPSSLSYNSAVPNLKLE